MLKALRLEPLYVQTIVRTSIVLGFAAIVGLLTGFLGLVYELAPISPDLFGYDWLWYRDGMDRVLAGLPLYDQQLLDGPYNQLTPAINFTWQQSPNVLSVVAPFYLLPLEWRQLAFGAFNAIAALGVLFLALPRRWPPVTRTALVLVVLLNPVTLSALWLANMNTLIAMGLVLVWIGRQRRSTALITAGLVMLGLKVIPAVLVGLWLLIRDRCWKPIAIAVAISVLMAVPAIATDGIKIIGQFIVVQLNAELAVYPTNVSLASIGSQLGVVIPQLYSSVLGMSLIAISLAPRLLKPAASLLVLVIGMCCMIQLLWIHWLFVVAAACLIWLNESVPVRRGVSRFEAWRRGSDLPTLSLQSD